MTLSFVLKICSVFKLDNNWLSTKRTPLRRFGVVRKTVDYLIFPIRASLSTCPIVRIAVVVVLVMERTITTAFYLDFHGFGFCAVVDLGLKHEQ
jgi:hypothetical protein